jgi:UDP-2,3-diacylglucosamine pyrophosphatase LpxH
MNKKYKSIFISDLHLGSRGCKADLLCNFLKHNTSDNLFLIGDIIDGWRLKKRFYFPQSHINVLRRILTASKRETNVVYIVGNHDEFLREFLKFRISFGNIKIVNHHFYNAVNGKKYLLIHGDMFDTFIRTNLKFLYHLGDFFYNLLLKVNVTVHFVRDLFNLPYWSLSAYLKRKTKEAVSYLNNFEELVVDYCKKRNAEGIICGHVHHAEIKKIGDVEYMNDGDWVESCSALVENHDGTWEIIYWEKMYDDSSSSDN